MHTGDGIKGRHEGAVGRAPAGANQMLRQVLLLLDCGLMIACTAGRPLETGGLAQHNVVVKRDSDLQETAFTIAAGDCRITWTVYGSEANRGVVRHRSDCGLTLGEQAPLMRKVLRKVMESGTNAAEFRTLSWGRLYPDGARDTTMPVRIAKAARRSADWDVVRGAPRGGDVNGSVRKLANDASIYEELRAIFQESGLEIHLTTVEKVLVQKAELLPFFERLRQAGVRPGDRVPYDCQAWFSVRPIVGKKAGGAGTAVKHLDVER